MRSPLLSISAAPAAALAAAIGLVTLAGGCAGSAGRLRFISSQPAQASWSFVVDDRARGASLLIDSRPREMACTRARSQLRCELRGLWPGGHTVELRLPGAVLRRSVLLGRAWPERPALVRARWRDEAKEAAEAGADGVIADGTDIAEVVDAAHAAGTRAFVHDPRDLELAGADGVIDVAIPAELHERFPEARALTGLTEAHDVGQAALALLAPRGAIVERNAFGLLRVRKKHASLARGSARQVVNEPERRAFELRHAGDGLLLLVNLGDEPWDYRADVPDPIDLLGSHVQAGVVTLRPHDVATIIRSPAPDVTRY